MTWTGPAAEIPGGYRSIRSVTGTAGARWPAQRGRSAACCMRPARPVIVFFRTVGGAGDDWASWSAQWLIDLSELPDLLGARPS
jgi:hypothetical protein